MKLVLVHGFNVKDKGKRTVDRLAVFAEKKFLVDTDAGDYGYFNLWMIRLVKSYLRSRVLYKLAAAFEKADVIITHSNGANFTTKALDMLGSEHNNTKLVIHISPAMNSKTAIPQAVKAQLVLHTRHDFWVKLSSYIPFHPWGRMGARGYKGDDNRNINISNDKVKAHSDWFKVEHVGDTWDHCRTFIEENLG